MRIALSAFLIISSFTGSDGYAQEEAPQGRNRLDAETSPYLRSHIDNPVHWYPWGEEAFEAAKTQNKPIFLSVGYSSCHWCHVMNRESFSDPEIAKMMNENFICIKLDREERPDVDQLYMNAVQALTGQGGWPLSVFLLPDGRPFFGGTYFPPEDRQVGDSVMVGFPKVMASVLDALATKAEDVERQAAGLSNYLRHQATAVVVNPVELSAQFVEEAATSISKQVDPEHGGFSRGPNYAPKFPQPSMGLFLIQFAEGHDKPQFLDPVAHLAKAMAKGGIYDQIGGGFHRYSVDREWIVPHFEKMLYDQAQLLSLYSRLYRLRPDPLYKRVVRETIAFLHREMTAPEKLFYSAIDADSEHEEGKFYVWETDELKQALGDDFDWVARYTGVDAGPNFEGKHIPIAAQSPKAMAQELGLTEAEFLKRWDRVKEKLLALREQRVRPLLDTKAIAAWNALTVVGLADAAESFEEPAYRELALESARAILTHLRKEDGSLYRHWIDGQGKGNAFADDYAAMALAMLAAHRLEESDEFLKAAEDFMQQLADDYWDPRGKGYFFTGKNQETLIAPLKESYDGATPSSNGMAALASVQLAQATGNDDYRKRVTEISQSFSNELNNSPGGSAVTLRALDLLYRTGQGEVAKETAVLPVGAAPNGPLERIETSPAAIRAKAGEKADFELRIVLRDPWHINANPASPDFLKPTLLQLKDDDSAFALQVRYPEAKHLEIGGLDEKVAVYEGTAVLTASLQLPADLEPGQIKLPLELHYQACDDSRCLAPARLPVEIVVEILP